MALWHNKDRKSYCGETTMMKLRLYTLDKREVINLLCNSLRYSALYRHMKLFCEGDEQAAQAFVFQQCKSAFRNLEDVRSAKDALTVLDDYRKKGYYDLSVPLSARKSKAELPEIHTWYLD